jgi:hypothetical protein
MQTYRPSGRDPLTGSFFIPLSRIGSFDSLLESGSTTCPSCPASALRDFASRSAASFVSRHPKCRDPELLATPYRNSRLRDFRDKSLDFLSSDMPKCRNSDTSSTRVPQRNFPPFSPFWSFDFAISGILMLSFRFFNPRNPEMVDDNSDPDIDLRSYM